MTRPTESQMDAAIKRVVHLTDIANALLSEVRAIEKAGQRALLESARLDGVRAERAALQRTIDTFAVELDYARCEDCGDWCHPEDLQSNEYDEMLCDNCRPLDPDDSCDADMLTRAGLIPTT
jgi:hypothetical protein